MIESLTNITKRIIIYTDGSLIGEKGGFAFLCFSPGSQVKPVVAYSNTKTESPLVAELLAIIRALEYLYYKGLTGYKVEVRTDVESVVKYFCREGYKRCHNSWWKNENSNHIKDDIDTWQALICLVESFPQGKIKFKKVISMKDTINRVAHKYSRIAQKMDLLDYGCLYVLEKSAGKKSYVFKEFIKGIEDENIKVIINKSKPQINNSNEKIQWYSHNDDVVYINAENIFLTEDIHLTCSVLNFNGTLNIIEKTRKINCPLAVRSIGGGKYSLVMGLVRYMAVKALNIKKVPCVITDMCHEEFKNYYSID